MADEHDLIKIPDFVRKLSPTGQEDIPVADETGTYKVKADSLVSLIASARGYVTSLQLNPVISSVSALETQERELRGLIEGFASQVGTGIIGEATPDTDPIASGFAIYTVSSPGAYTNFLDGNGTPIEVMSTDLEANTGGLVQLWGNNDVWEKHVTVISASDTIAPEFTDNLSDI